MKNILIAFLFISSIGFAQDSTIVKAETPKIVSKLAFGETLQFNDIEIEFVAVLSDSRCPKNVTCIRAGEAVVLVAIFKNGKKIEQKKLVFTPTSYLQNRIGNLFASKDLNISGFNISPYPVAGTETNPEDYYLQLEVRR